MLKSLSWNYISDIKLQPRGYSITNYAMYTLVALYNELEQIHMQVLLKLIVIGRFIEQLHYKFKSGQMTI